MARNPASGGGSGAPIGVRAGEAARLEHEARRRPHIGRDRGGGADHGRRFGQMQGEIDGRPGDGSDHAQQQENRRAEAPGHRRAESGQPDAVENEMGLVAMQEGVGQRRHPDLVRRSVGQEELADLGVKFGTRGRAG